MRATPLARSITKLSSPNTNFYMKKQKKIIIISSSPRPTGNSNALADEFAKGAIQAGHEVEKITLFDKSLKFCVGCLSCQKTRKCVIKDDVADILPKLSSCDIIVFATPIYYYEMSGQMKTFIDRMNPLYDTDYKFTETYLLATAAENEESAIDGAINGLKGWIACFDRVKLSGVVRGVGATSLGDISQKHLKEAFEMGLNA